MQQLKRAPYFQRGEQTFQCWHYVDINRHGGAWMVVFYECFGFFVFHTAGSELDRGIDLGQDAAQTAFDS